MKRLITVALMVAALATPGVAAADDELREILEDAAGAEFHGDGIVLCNWDGDSAAATYDVTRSGGMSMVHGPGGDVMVSGALTAVQSGADWYGLEVGEWSAWSLSDRYAVSAPEPVVRLGRPASVVTVSENGRPRARLIIDDESTIPLVTEILDGDGTLFRLAALIDFQPGPVMDMPDMPPFHSQTMVMPTAEPGSLPAQAAGYRRADTYAGPDETIQAFYTDGLFSFSIFESKRGERPDAFDDATRFQVDGETYRRLVTPSHVWVHWQAPNRSYLLVGDLPPDHIVDVLGELPEPGNRGLFVRMWRRLFG